MSVDVKTAPKIEAGTPKPLFKLPLLTRFSRYAPTSDGKRFLVLEGDPQAPPDQTMVVLNWPSELKPR